MTVTSGFYDSYNGDRVYTADQFCSFFDGLINDGVYSAVGYRFYVTAAGGLNVYVESGRAWFDRTWTFNSQKLTLAVPAPDTVYPRIDAVIIEINKDERRNTIKIKKGTASSNPSRPSLTKSTSLKQYALAYISVGRNVSSISNSNIENVVGQPETPLITFMNVEGMPVMKYSTTDITAGKTTLYTGTLYLVYE